MKFNKLQIGVLMTGLVIFFVLAPHTEQAFVETIVLIDIAGKIFDNRH
jgi:hypothetical protein